MMHTLQVPRRFWDDHCERLSPQCEEIEGKRYSTITLNDEQLEELLSDAVYYAEGWPDDAPRGLVISARATVNRVNAYIAINA